MLSAPLVAFGLAQLAATLQNQLHAAAAEGTDFLAYYGAARIFLEQPAQLYDASAHEALQSALQSGRIQFVPFVSPPHVALVQSPLGWLPFGWAYIAWAVINVLCLGVSAYLLAGRDWLLWLAGMPLFVPVLFALVMGQTSCAMLLGFSVFARLALDGRLSVGALALVTWTWKPNFVPALGLALLVGRHWRALIAFGLATVVLLGAAAVRIGWPGFIAYVGVATERLNVAALRPDGYREGATLLVAAQDALGVGSVATGIGLLGAGLVYLAIALLWRHGLTSGPERYLQLAALPLASTIASPHAGIYELVTWLPSVWLLLAYVRAVPSARTAVLTIVLGIWATGNLSVIGEGTSMIVLPGLVGALGVAWAAMRGWRLPAR